MTSPAPGDGAAQLRFTVLAPPRAAEGVPGAVGFPGRIASEAGLHAEVPLLLEPTAATLKVYDTVPVRPVTVQLVASAFAGGTLQPRPPGVDCTEYVAIPELTVGLTQDTVTEVPSASRATVGAPGAPGAPATTPTDELLADELPVVPTPTAITWNVYDVPGVRPLITHGGAVLAHVKSALWGDVTR